MKRIFKFGIVVLLVVGLVLPQNIIANATENGSSVAQNQNEVNEAGSDVINNIEELEDSSDISDTQEMIHDSDESNDEKDGSENNDIDTLSDNSAGELSAINSDSIGELVTASGIQGISYSAHVANIGWQNTVSNGTTAGTTGKSLYMESIKVSVTGIDGVGVSYQVHQANYGWEDWVSDGGQAGETGKSLHLEAIKVKLTGTNAANYEVQYRAHVQNIGWQDWVSDGELAGTTGQGLGIEAIELRIVTDESTISAPENSIIAYRAHVQNIGWQNTMADGGTAGTTGQGLQVEAIRIAVNNISNLGVTYQVHQSNVGWQDWVSNGSIAGITGKGYQLEALKIKLTGANTSNYRVEYRAHVQNIGWQDWVKDGQLAGTTGNGYRIEALEIRVVEKVNELYYQAHVENIGWQSDVEDGEVAGTTGNGYHIEALKLSLRNPRNLGISYRTHVSGIGWMDWTNEGNIAGTTGEARQIEAIEIKLTGSDANKYDLYYATHVSNYGWLNWTSNGAMSGTRDLGYGIEAIEIKLVAKGDTAPTKIGSLSISKIAGVSSLTYQSHVQNIGWQGSVSDGAISGTTGQGLRIEALNIVKSDPSIGGSVQYNAHVQDIGWQGWVSDGQVSGTTNQSKQVEAIQIRLTGELAESYDVYYRTSVENIGWTGWAGNGQSCGNKGYGRYIEAIQIKLVAKAQSAPGTTEHAFYEKQNSIIIVLDPGHDGRHAGASGGGLQEQLLTPRIAAYCKAELETYPGVKVYLTHDGTNCPVNGASNGNCLVQRVNYAKSVGADAFVSLHLDSSTNTGANGATVYRQNYNYNASVASTSAAIAENIENNLVGLGIKRNGTTPRSTVNDKYPDGTTQDFYSVLRNSKLQGMPAVIVEHCYISNASDRSRFLSNNAQLQQLGIADARGIAATFGLTK